MRKVRKNINNKKLEYIIYIIFFIIIKQIILIIVLFLKKLKLNIIRKHLKDIIRSRFFFWLFFTLMFLLVNFNSLFFIIFLLFFKILEEILIEINDFILVNKYDSYLYSYEKIKERKGYYDKMLESVYIFKEIGIDRDIEIEKFRWIATSKIIDTREEKELKIYNENIY